jgi:hypothetical protein
VTCQEFTARYEGRTQFLNTSGRAGAESKFKVGQLESGFSGRPLLNLRTGRVMGVVVASRDRHRDLGGWAIELPLLINWLEELGIRLPAIDTSWTDAEAKQHQDSTPDQLQAVITVLKAETSAQARAEKLSQTLGKQAANVNPVGAPQPG